MNSKQHSHFINGQWIKGLQPLYAINPATGDTIWEGSSANQEIVDLAIQSAKEAFWNWSNLELGERIKYLEAFRESLLRSKQPLAEAISKNTGKPLWEAATEVAAMANKITISIEAYQMRCPEIRKELPQGISKTTHRPHGVMAVLGPFNLPGHLPNGHIVPSLLAGNTIVFKPSEFTPLVAEEILKCWESCGLPNGVINLIQGSKETGRSLAEHPGIDGLLFTGSWNTGRHLAEYMAKTPYKILALEMGGNNPLVIGSISDFSAASYATIQSAFITSGQRCTCARRIMVPRGSNGDAFIETLVGMTKEIRIGPYTDHPEPFMGPMISPMAAENLLNDQKKLIDMGAEPLIALSQWKNRPAFLTPGIIDVTKITPLPDEEYFGPFLQVVRTDNFDEAIKEANQTHYGLVAGLFSDREEEYRYFFKSVRAGIINWNTPLTGASSSAPFGGIGKSGNNRPSALYAADYCAYPVASLISPKLKMPATISPGISSKDYSVI